MWSGQAYIAMLPAVGIDQGDQTLSQEYPEHTKSSGENFKIFSDTIFPFLGRESQRNLLSVRFRWRREHCICFYDSPVTNA